MGSAPCNDPGCATLGAEIPAPVRPLGRTWHQLGYHLLAVPAGPNAGIVEILKVSPSAVEKYVTNIFIKLDLPPTSTDHRRVLAVLKYLGS
jgi:hypothetical protein